SKRPLKYGLVNKLIMLDFNKDSKSEAEYYQILLYSKDKIHYSKALKYMYEFYLNNQSIEEKIEYLTYNNFPNYRISEVLAIDSLYNKENNSENMQQSYFNSFLYKLIKDKNLLVLLANRNYIYSITHTIFYCTYFNCTNFCFEEDYSELVKILTDCLLISIRKGDIDVLLEVAVCVYILNLSGKVDRLIMEMTFQTIKDNQAKDGFIYPTTMSKQNFTNHKEQFDYVYHTTLVGKLLKEVIEN
ncbi:MAG: DUF6895 family protein, partial [Ruoffia tabacinasalis]